MKFPQKQALTHITVHLRVDRLTLIDDCLDVTRQSRNAWVLGLIDEALPRLARSAERKRRRLKKRLEV